MQTFILTAVAALATSVAAQNIPGFTYSYFSDNGCVDSISGPNPVDFGVCYDAPDNTRGLSFTSETVEADWGIDCGGKRVVVKLWQSSTGCPADQNFEISYGPWDYPVTNVCNGASPRSIKMDCF